MVQLLVRIGFCSWVLKLFEGWFCLGIGWYKLVFDSCCVPFCLSLIEGIVFETLFDSSLHVLLVVVNKRLILHVVFEVYHT